MRGLKALVIGMAVLIVMGLAVVAFTIATRSGNDQTAGVPGAPGDSGLPGGFGERRMAIPPGARVVRSHGAGARLIIQLALADGTPRFLVIDPATGRLLGRLDLAPE